jgi:uncharacterized protein YukE
MPNALDSFLELEKEGKTNPEIVMELQNRGFSPQEVNDAVNQSKIKKAVTSPEGMQPSIMEEPEQVQPPVPTPTKKKKMPFSMTAPAQAPEYQYQQQSYEYGSAQQPIQGAGADIETIEEISEEIVNEKMTELRDELENIKDFKQSVQSKIDDMDDRLKRIELNIDRLQASMIGKVQEYGQSIKDLGSEMRAVEGAFSNVLNPLIDNIKELGSITEKIKAKEKKAEK